jgi:pyruvate dehydrogenase E2 component (dihydrolipoamide acetyltransferase)
MADGSENQGQRGAAVETAKGSGERIELSKRAQAVARRVAESKATIPHIHLGRTLHCPGLEPDRVAAEAVAAVAGALADFPLLNSAYRDGGIEPHARVNVGLIVELEEGALVPTLFDADSKDVDAIADEIERLSAGAHDGSLTSPDLAGGTFTVSILDAGADRLAGPVTPGQSGHLGVGRLRDDGTLGLTLSCDQRAVRAPVAASFLDHLAGSLGDEAPRRGS